MEEAGADFAVQLSSELISEIVQEYFDKKLFKRKVEILDLKPTQDGYAFVIKFTKAIPKPSSAQNLSVTISQPTNSTYRNNKGQFTKVG